ncbi:hypothetical protein [Cognatilysobacter bugurensis]|nr:hypothetical protein [Lysobacter bugurensis]
MRTSIFCLPVLLAFAGGAYAQSQSDIACPQLPADSGLIWQHKATAKSDFCRALRPDGSEAFGLFIANDSPFKPTRGNRAEQAVIDGREVQWYRSELAAQPDVQARETLIELPDGRVAHVWVQAKTQQQLDQALSQTADLRFRNAQLSSK